LADVYTSRFDSKIEVLEAESGWIARLPGTSEKFTLRRKANEEHVQCTKRRVIVHFSTVVACQDVRGTIDP